MPRTRYHAKLEQDRKLREETKAMTTNETTNGNGQLTTANLNKLASALGETYTPPTVEDILFGDNPINPLLSELAKLLGSNESNLAEILINDTLTGNGNKSRLLRLLLDEAKVKQLEQQKQILEQQKQDLLLQVQTLDQQLNSLSGSYAALKSVIG